MATVQHAGRRLPRPPTASAAPATSRTSQSHDDWGLRHLLSLGGAGNRVGALHIARVGVAFPGATGAAGATWAAGRSAGLGAARNACDAAPGATCHTCDAAPGAARATCDAAPGADHGTDNCSP